MEVVTSRPENTAEQVDQPVHSESPAMSPHIEAPSFADLFGLEPTKVNEKQREMLARIIDWARSENPDISSSELRWFIIQKKNSLGAPPIGSTMLDKLHRWVIAYRGFKMAETELKSIEGI